MKKPNQCSHTRLDLKCPGCVALKRKWYGLLVLTGFSDVEYGLEHPERLAHTPDPTASAESSHFYERAWEVYHVWVSLCRSKRDCRIAELFAMQEGDTGTMRGISRVLKAEGLAPSSPWAVFRVVSRIRAAIENGIIRLNRTTSKDPPSYFMTRNACA